jgi:hypothetical protein
MSDGGGVANVTSIIASIASALGTVDSGSVIGTMWRSDLIDDTKSVVIKCLRSLLAEGQIARVNTGLVAECTDGG